VAYPTDPKDPNCQFSVTVRQSVRDRLEAEVQERGSSIAAVVREAILEWLRRQAIRRSRAS